MSAGSLVIKPVADLRGGARDAPIPWGSKYFHFHAIFGQKEGSHTHLGSWRPPGENPRSATESIWFFSSLMVFLKGINMISLWIAKNLWLRKSTGLRFIFIRIKWKIFVSYKCQKKLTMHNSCFKNP